MARVERVLKRLVVAPEVLIELLRIVGAEIREVLARDGRRAAVLEHLLTRHATELVVRPQRVSCHDGLVRMIGQRHRIDDCPRRCIHMDDSRGRPLDEDPEAACAIGLRVGSGAANVDVAEVCRVAGPDVGEGLQEGRRHPDLRAGNGDATGRDG